MKNIKTIGKSLINNIRLIEIELTSQCNRTCNFCPNSYIDRHSENKVLDRKAFEKLINELAKYNYSKFISFSRYNEPFMHKDILNERIRFIKMNLPNAKLVTNTNGDFDTDMMHDIEITEMDYDGNKKCYISEDKTYRVMRLGEINNRGGALDIKQKERDFPCYEPKHFVGIDYTGDVMPCCNLRHDVEEHKPYILGNIKDNSLEEILISKKALMFRGIAASGKQSLLEPPCKECLKTEGRYTRENGGIE